MSKSNQANLCSPFRWKGDADDLLRIWLAQIEGNAQFLERIGCTLLEEIPISNIERRPVRHATDNRNAVATKST